MVETFEAGGGIEDIVGSPRITGKQINSETAATSKDSFLRFVILNGVVLSMFGKQDIRPKQRASKTFRIAKQKYEEGTTHIGPVKIIISLTTERAINSRRDYPR